MNLLPKHDEAWSYVVQTNTECIQTNQIHILNICEQTCFFHSWILSQLKYKDTTNKKKSFKHDHFHTHTHKSVWSSSLKHTTQNYNYRSKNYTKVPGSAKTQIWLFAPEPDQRHILDMIVIILKKPHCLHAEKNPNRYPYKEHKKLQSINVPAGLSCKAFSKTWSDIMKLKAQVQKATMTRKREDSIL